MGELVMTSYKPRSDPQDEVDPRVSLILDPQNQTQPTNPETKPLNGASTQNGNAAAIKKKSGIKHKLSLEFLRKRKRCRIITVVIVTIAILSLVGIILALILKPPDKDSHPKNQNKSSPKTRHKSTSSPPSSTSTKTFTTTATTTTSTTEMTSPYVPFPGVNTFVRYPDSSDSRLFQVELSNSEIIRTYGLKSKDGNLLTLNSISVVDGTGSNTHIRFGTRSNMASVMLSDGTYVSYDMSDDLRNIEMRIFTGDLINTKPTTPVAFVQSVAISGDVLYLNRLLSTISDKNRASERIKQSRTSENKTCISYLPLRVTKCGSQYPYEGAFIEGKVRIGGNSRVLMTALPWPSNGDECFQKRWESNTKPNYYIPIPTMSNLNGLNSDGVITRNNCDSWMDYFLSLCSSREVYDEGVHNTSCVAIASQASSAQNGNSVIYSSVYSSCQKIFSSINSMCSSLQYKSTEDNPIWKLTKDVLASSLCPIDEVPTPPPVSETEIIAVDVLAFCPSQMPFSSPEQIINIHPNQSKSVGSPIHINCDGSPEVTYVSAGHAYTGIESLDRVMHRFKVCSICAFESSVRAVLVSDKICCDDTCSGNRDCRSGHTPYLEESTFKVHSSVYCKDFFLDRSYRTQSLDFECVGQCDTDLTVNFTMFDSSAQRTFYHQTVSCREDKMHACKMEFGR